MSLKQPGLGARNAVPPNFGYFAVEFGITGGGYAKVIEDWSSFPIYFGRVSSISSLDYLLNLISEYKVDTTESKNDSSL